MARKELLPSTCIELDCTRIFLPLLDGMFIVPESLPANQVLRFAEARRCSTIWEGKNREREPSAVPRTGKSRDWKFWFPSDLLCAPFIS